ncbi:hypothetical protein [Bifidobacterium miconis]|uniref:hypothetical protein n=1 Tax=Bifidobacterium miconis TaxID=2834435 RepID=UPI00308432E9
MLRECPDALRADLRRVYGLDLDDLETGRLRVGACADLVANLPAGSMTWRRLDVAAAWTPVEYMLAVQVDQMNMWMWGNADPKKRGSKPKPLPRPGRGHAASRDDGTTGSDGREHRVRAIGVQPMTLGEFSRWRAQRFEDARVEESRPLAGNT